MISLSGFLLISTLQQGAANCISICHCVNALVFPLLCHNGMQGRDSSHMAQIKSRANVNSQPINIPSTTTGTWHFACRACGNTLPIPAAFPACLAHHARLCRTKYTLRKIWRWSPQRVLDTKNGFACSWNVRHAKNILRKICWWSNYHINTFAHFLQFAQICTVCARCLNNAIQNANFATVAQKKCNLNMNILLQIIVNKIVNSEFINGVPRIFVSDFRGVSRTDIIRLKRKELMQEIYPSRVSKI
jgi:hypothetical protein